MNNKKFIEFLKYFVICALILVLLVFVLWKYKLTLGFLKELFKIIRPLIIGAAIAFILNRPLLKIQSLYKKLFNKDNKLSKSGKERTFYALSIATTYVIFLAIVAGIITFIVPQLVSSVTFFIDSFDTYYQNFMKFINDNFSHIDLSWIKNTNILEKIYQKLYSLTEYIPEFLTTTFGVTKGIISGFADVFIGLIFSVYVLAEKKKLKSQISRTFKVICNQSVYKKITNFYRLFSDTFSHFIAGQLTEAFILGILCFVGMSIFGFEYAVLISVIIGLTNMVPIFGPIIGTIPCSLILLLVNPIHAVWFIVFIIILQQLESNLIYPRVVGGSVGLAPFWTLISIIIGGGVFGVVGMIFAVPTMSVIYKSVGTIVNKKYKEKQNIKEENNIKNNDVSL